MTMRGAAVSDNRCRLRLRTNARARVGSDGRPPASSSTSSSGVSRQGKDSSNRPNRLTPTEHRLRFVGESGARGLGLAPPRHCPSPTRSTTTRPPQRRRPIRRAAWFNPFAIRRRPALFRVAAGRRRMVDVDGDQRTGPLKRQIEALGGKAVRSPPAPPLRPPSRRRWRRTPTTDSSPGANARNCSATAWTRFLDQTRRPLPWSQTANDGAFAETSALRTRRPPSLCPWVNRSARLNDRKAGASGAQVDEGAAQAGIDLDHPADRTGAEPASAPRSLSR